MEPIEVEPYNQPTKKLNSKTQSTTSTDQHKSTKNEGFYKAKEIKKTPLISENINIENNSTKILKNQIKNLNTNIELKTYNAGEKPTKKEDVINEIDKIISELPPNSTDILLLSIKDNTINRLKGDEINTESDNWDNNFLKINYRKNP